MPLFEVTLSDGSTSIMQAHNKTHLKAALQQVKLTRIVQMRRCKQCKKAPATVQGTFCQPCWDTILPQFREEWKDLPMTEEELQNIAMSFFVDA